MPEDDSIEIDSFLNDSSDSDQNRDSKGFDIVWNFLPHISTFQFLILIGISTVSAQTALWTISSVFGFYKPQNYRCRNAIDQLETIKYLNYTKKKLLLGYRVFNLKFISRAAERPYKKAVSLPYRYELGALT